MYEKYAKFRDAAGLNDFGVSKLTGISTATLTGWKHGRFQPKVDKLQKIAKALGCSITDFLEEP